MLQLSKRGKIEVIKGLAQGEPLEPGGRRDDPQVVNLGRDQIQEDEVRVSG